MKKDLIARSFMEVEFAKLDLQRLETDESFDAGYSKIIVRAYKKVLRFIRSALDERDFYAMRSLNFEKLRGERSHQYSLRLNIQWRLIIEIKESKPKNIIIVIGIEDYH
jgi:toxin HigB-1